MKKENKKIVLGILVLVGILLFLNFTGFFTVSYTQATTYNSWDVDLNRLELIYSDTSTEALRANAFKSIHALSEDARANEFQQAEQNKRFWRFFLESNGVDSSAFYDYSGRKLSGIFSPNNIPGGFHNELESLGFSYNHYTQTAEVYVGDQTYICGSSNCCADPSWFVIPKSCYSHLQIVVVGEEAFWSGGYKSSIMSDMANRMACYVEGKTTALANDIYIKPDRSQPFVQSYKIYGEASFDRDSFICLVNTKELFDELPKIFIRPSDGAEVSVGGAGVDGKVVFYFGERIYRVYRLENNLCNLLEVESSDRRINDYLSLEDCQKDIINYIDIYRLENNLCIKYQIDERFQSDSDYPTLDICKNNIINYINIYRIENNVCNPYSIDENDLTNLEYTIFSECQLNLIKKQTYFRFQNEVCTEISIFPSEAKDFDYSTLEECEVNLLKTNYLFLIIGGGIILIFIVLIFFVSRKK